MTIESSDDIDLTEEMFSGLCRASKSAGRYVAAVWKERLPLKREGFARVYCEVGPYRLRELAFI